MEKESNIILSQSKVILISLLIILSVIVAIFSYLGSLQKESFMQAVVKEEKSIAKRIYLQTFASFVSKYDLIAESLLADKEIISAFEQRDREKLKDLTMPTFKKLQKENPFLKVMHFHTPTTHSFLRLHKPHKFGDDLSSIRHLINRVNNQQIKQIGLEVGRYGIYYRVALPVFNENNEHLGAFEFGIDFNYIITIFKNTYGFDSILLFKKEIFDIIFSHSENFLYSEYSKDYYEVNHQWSSEVSNGENVITFKVNVITDSTEKVIGRILFKKNLDYLTKDIEHTYNNLLIVVALLVLISLFLILTLFKKYFSTIKTYQEELGSKQDALMKMSNTDFLTNIHNRKSMDCILHSEIERSKRYGHALSVILFDVDDFKLVNDTHGHDVGDEVLKDIAKIVSSHIRQTDYFGRWGGEEFIVVLTETPLDIGYQLTQKIKEKIFSHDFNGLTVSCSFGIAEYLSHDTFESIIHNADIALYQSKNNGKNIVTIYND